MIPTLENNQDISNVVWKRQSGLYRARCPHHTDNTPSLTLYPSGQAHCYGCNRHWWNVSVNGLSFDYTESAEQVNEPIHPDFIQYWHKLLMEDNLYDYFIARGFTLDTIKREMWGWEPVMARYVITVWNGEPSNSDVVQVRLRTPLKDAPNKYIGLPGHNFAELYNSHVLKSFPNVCFFFGELDAQLATQWGFPSVSMTNGKGTFRAKWLEKFADTKRVVIIPDRGEEIDACIIASNFSGRAEVKTLPLTVNGKDIKDFGEFVQHGGTFEQFANLLNGTGESFGVEPWFTLHFKEQDADK